jgi:hypothetical protein
MPSLPPSDLIPPDGLLEVLRGWSGRGLLVAVGALPPGGDLFDREWRATETLARARRALLSYLAEARDGQAGLISRLPQHADKWFDLIPATALRHRHIDESPFRGVNWELTRRIYGWPPTAFCGRLRHRVIDDALLAPLAWVLDKLIGLREYESALPPDLYKAIQPAMRAATEVLQHEEVRQVMPGHRPTGESYATLVNEGSPWSTIAEIGRILVSVDDDPLAAAELLLFPDEAISWRLFHLACLGEVLLALDQQGYRVTSQRALGGEATGPAYQATKNERQVDVWFEAAGAWRHYDAESPYRNAAPFDGRPLGADILLRTSDGKKAVLIECKYYMNNPQQIPRDGYIQALAYAAEAHGRLASEVCAIAVGPERLLSWLGHTTTPVGTVYICSHVHLRDLISGFLIG